MDTFDIQIWDAVILPGSSSPRPVIYIENPGYESSQQVDVYITSTEPMPYTNRNIEAFIENSGLVLGYRPNFQAKTGLVGIILDTEWAGYPLVDMGQVKLPSTGAPEVLTETTETYRYQPSRQRQCHHIYKLAYMSLIITLILLYVIYTDKK